MPPETYSWAILGHSPVEFLQDTRTQNTFQNYSRFVRESETTIKIKFAIFRGGLGRGAGRKIVQNAIFHGNRHDNKILKVKFLLSRNFVVMAQAPTLI